jgi:hypothetical protein
MRENVEPKAEDFEEDFARNSQQRARRQSGTRTSAEGAQKASISAHRWWRLERETVANSLCDCIVTLWRKFIITMRQTIETPL